MFILRPFIITLVALAVLDWLLPNVTTGSWTTLLLAAAVLTILTSIVKPILNVLLLPITIITLGIFSTVITIFLMWLATIIVPGFHIDPVMIGSYWIGQWIMLLLFSIALNLIKSLVSSIWSE